MENYIKILGQKIELTDEQAEAWSKAVCGAAGDDRTHLIQPFFQQGEQSDNWERTSIEQVKIGDVPKGETCKIGDYEVIVLSQNADSTEILFKDLIHDSEEFGGNNNFDGSNVDKLCDTFYGVIAGIVGKDAFVEHTVDLTSDDGLKDYGEVRRMMSLLTTEQYRQYVDILDKYNPKKWWWLATPYSTPRHENSSWVKCVSPSGGIGGGNCYIGGGVRPLCILKSNIYVSK